MSKKRRNTLILLLLLLGLTVGFGALSLTLKINGNTIIEKNTWGIYWDNIANESGITPAQDHGAKIVPDEYNNPKSKVTFDVTFDKPGDYYEFTVDAVNSGSIDAKVIGIQKEYDDVVIDEDHPLPAYFKYTITYLDDTEVQLGDKLSQAPDPVNEPVVLTRKTIKVHVEYDKSKVTNSDINGQTSDVSHSFGFELQYGQDSNPDVYPGVEEIIAAIEANPDDYRNPEQDPTNRDIAIGRRGNVLNLNVWTTRGNLCNHGWAGYYHYWDNKAYTRRIIGLDGDPFDGIPLYVDEVTIGPFDVYGGCHTPATAEANIINGEMKYEIPAYIMLDGEDKFYPVTEISGLFANDGGCVAADCTDSPDPKTNVITKMPEFPPTLRIIGTSSFVDLEKLERVVIPRQIEQIYGGAFLNAFNPSGENNILTFEKGSKLNSVWGSAFAVNSLKGNLVIPSKVRYIGAGAFGGNHLTSVKLPTAADIGDDPFDEGVTLIRY